MRDPGTFDHPRAFQVYQLGSQIVEKPDAISQQDGHQLNAYCVDQPRLDGLLRHVRPAHAHVLVARDRFRLFDGALYAIRDKGEE